MKKLFIILISSILLLAMSSAAYALKVQEAPYASTFHLGLIFGPGMGIDLGADFLFPINSLDLGLEGEIIITDHEFEVNLNGRRVGGVLRYEFLEDFFSSALHFGKTWFTVSRDVDYLDIFSGKRYALYADEGNSATYMAFSLDFIVWDEYILTPKLVMNSVDGGGTLLEVNLNLGHDF